MSLVRIPGFPLMFADEFGSVYSVRRNDLRELKQHLDSCGYLKLKAYGRVQFAHRLIAAAFLGGRPEGMEVNHKDGNKENNCAVNLEYVTHAENMRHARATGLLKNAKGEASLAAKLTDEQASALRSEYWANVKDGRLPRGVRHEIAARYGVSPQYVRLVGLGCTRRYHDKGQS